jgi:hypothetical protein
MLLLRKRAQGGEPMKKCSLGFLMILSWSAWAGEVANGKKPAGKPMTLDFKQSLILGPQLGADEYVWGSAVVMDVDSTGRIILGDTFNARTLLFDAEGKFLKVLASKGNGPGEIQSVLAVRALADDRIVLMEVVQNAGMTKFHFFSAEGTLLDTRQVVGWNFWQNADIAPDGSTLAGMLVRFDMGTGKMFWYAGVADMEFNFLRKAIGEGTRSGPDFQRFSEGSYWSDYLGENFRLVQNMGQAGIFRDGTQFLIPNRKYEIQFFKPGAEAAHLSVRKEYDPIPNPEEEIMALVEPIRDQIVASLPGELQGVVTEQVVADAVRKGQFSPVKPPINGLVDLEEMGFLVIREISIRNKRFQFDLFDRKGNFLGEASLAGSALNLGGVGGTMVARAGKLYLITPNEDEEPLLIRYDLTIRPL